MAAFTLIHTNDLHGRLSPAKLPSLLDLRGGADFYFDSGDCVKSGNLTLPIFPDDCWPLLEAACCDAICPGNRESHPFVAGKNGKLSGNNSLMLCANWKTRAGELVFPTSHIFERSGVTVGVFGVMVAMVTPRMKTQLASAYLWDPPLEAAVAVARELRSQCDVVIALTHIGLTQDRQLASMTTDIDLILGAHSHSVLVEPEIAEGTPICQGGSHARFVGRYVFEPGRGLISGGLMPWT